MAEVNYNKVIFGGKTLIDLTGDTASESTVLSGQTFHDKSGAKKVGACTFDSDTQDASASVAEILKGKTAYARKSKLTGTMPNNGAVHLEIQSKGKPATIPQGYHDGSGTADLNAADKAKLIPENLREGIEILDVVGTMTGLEDVRAEKKTVTPSLKVQTVLPGVGFNYLSQVTVEGIPYAETDNSAGGMTATIGGSGSGGGMVGPEQKG